MVKITYDIFAFGKTRKKMISIHVINAICLFRMYIFYFVCIVLYYLQCKNRVSIKHMPDKTFN